MIERANTMSDLEKRGIGSRATLYRRIEEGVLIARKLGGRTVVLENDLQDYLKTLPVVPARTKQAA
jgi:hypothetical protein